MRLTPRGQVVALAAVLIAAFLIGYLTATWTWTDLDWLESELQ